MTGHRGSSGLWAIQQTEPLGYAQLTALAKGQSFGRKKGLAHGA